MPGNVGNGNRLNPSSRSQLLEIATTTNRPLILRLRLSLPNFLQEIPPSRAGYVLEPSRDAGECLLRRRRQHRLGRLDPGDRESNRGQQLRELM